MSDYIIKKEGYVWRGDLKEAMMEHKHCSKCGRSVFPRPTDKNSLVQHEKCPE